MCTVRFYNLADMKYTYAVAISVLKKSIAQPCYTAVLYLRWILVANPLIYKRYLCNLNNYKACTVTFISVG